MPCRIIADKWINAEKLMVWLFLGGVALNVYPQVDNPTTFIM
jgi:hypothetical protein